jgi:cystathionine beta-lyase
VETRSFHRCHYDPDLPDEHLRAIRAGDRTRATSTAARRTPRARPCKNALATLENGKHGLCFASGMASIDAVVKLLKPGDKVVSTNDLYGGNVSALHQDLRALRHPVSTSWTWAIRLTWPRPSPRILKLIWVENAHQSHVADRGHRRSGEAHQKTKTSCSPWDNTFASPYLQNPMDLGADIVMHSVTKIPRWP